MKKYFIKGFFSDWREVSQEEYDKFVEHLIQNSPMPNKEKIVSFHTKIIQEGANLITCARDIVEFIA